MKDIKYSFKISRIHDDNPPKPSIHDLGKIAYLPYLRGNTKRGGGGNHYFFSIIIFTSYITYN